MFKHITRGINKLVKFCEGDKINSELLSAIFVYLMITPIDAILYLQWINTMQNYTWVSGAIIYPMFGFLFFAIPTLIMKNKKYILNKMSQCCVISNNILDIFDKSVEEITDEQINYPKKELIQIGCMDSIGSILGALSAPFISIMLNVIFGKLTLPLTMFASYFFLNKKYKKYHYIGVATTIFGILVASIPKFYMTNTKTNPIWLILYILSLIPSVFSYIIKEKYMQKYKNANSWYMNTYISIYQILIGLCSLIFLKFPIPNLYVNNINKYMKNALECQFFGIENDCKYSLLYLFVFQIFGTIANQLMFTIIRKGSAVIFIMINTIKTPITALMGFFLIYFRVITYTKEQKFVITWLDIVSLILIIIGAVLYTSSKEKLNIENDKYKFLIETVDDYDSDDQKENEIILNSVGNC